jgi:predicted acyl esterase
VPVLAHRRRLPVTMGEVMRLTIALSSSSTFFAAGEGLRLLLSGSPINPSAPYRKDTSANRGQHVFHFGGEAGAHLLVPRIPD